MAKKYAYRVDLDKIPCTSTWTKKQAAGVPEPAENPAPV